MTDYLPLIARAVEGLARNTGEARRALYERARAALVAQLRGVEPALSESEITKERLALEEAIRKVEGEAARKALTEPRAPKNEPRPSAQSSRQAANDAALANDEPPSAAEPPPPSKPSARSRILEARTSSLTQGGLKGFRGVVNEVDGLGAASARAAQSARETRDSYAPAATQRPQQAEDLDQVHDRLEPHFPEDDLHDHEAPQLRSLEPDYNFQDEPPLPPARSGRPQPPPPADYDEDEHYEEPREPRSYRRWAKLAAMVIILGGLAATVSWQWPRLAGLYDFVTHLKSSPPTQPAQNPTEQKFTGRVPQEQVPGQAPAASPPASQPTTDVAQRAVLYEADPSDPQGKRYPGSVVWRTETVSPGAGMAPELVVRADIAIPERHMTVTWSLRRNTDKSLPASHTIELMFNLPPDFSGGGIANVPGILMKDNEGVRGMPLAGLAVNVTTGFFLIGLNAAEQEMQRNMQLLKEREWFDILLVYNNQSRAILTIEKGPPGDRVFKEAFAAWGQ
jgi:hypothetical protein